MPKIDATKLNLEEKVIYINRCAKVVKGGRRFSFAAVCAVGDRAGHVGVGTGKAQEIPDAIRKAIEKAKKNLVEIEFTKNTVPFLVTCKVGASKVMLKPAFAGSGIVAGGSVRVILELVGIKDILTKTIGSSSPLNVAAATIKCLQEIASSYRVKNNRIMTYTPTHPSDEHPAEATDTTTPPSSTENFS